MHTYYYLPLLLLITLCSPALPAQNVFQRLSEHSFFDQCNGLEILADQSAVLAGSYASTTDTQPVIWVQRISAQGTLLWSRQYADRRGSAVDVCNTTDGNLLVAFNLQAPAGIPLGVGGWMKLSPLGEVLWARLTTTPAHFNHLRATPDGYLLSGYTRAGGDFDQDAIVLKIKENGDIAWSQRWDMPGDDGLTSTWADAQGFVYCSGYANANAHLDAILARLSPAGSLMWARRYGGSGDDLFFSAAPGQLTGQDGLLAIGYSASYGLVYGEMWTLFADLDGNVRSAHTFAVPERDFAAHHLSPLPGGQWVVAASDAHFSAGSPGYLLRMTADGLLSWAYQYRSGGERDAFRRVKTRNGGFAAAGTAANGGDRGAFLTYLGHDGLLLECCPLDAAIDIKSVSPTTQSFVPATLALPSTLSQPFWGSAPTDTELRNPCTPIDVSFSLSDTLVRIGECVDIILPDTVAGVQYTLDLQGGKPDPADPLHVCYPDCGRYFITRSGQSSVCKKTFFRRVDVGGTDDVVPNAFTPNGDQVNDRFRPLLACPPERMSFEVYDRWGKKVFSTQDPKTPGWDGTLDGQPAPADVYAWRLEYEIVRDGALQGLTQKGDVTLLR